MTAIYHITHVDNLGAIVGHGGLLCDNGKIQQGLAPVSIAHQHIKDRRSRKRVPVPPRGTLHDYVPFYFAPRSPMLFAISKGNVAGYTEGQTPIVHLASSIERVSESGLPFAFSDGHADMAISQFFNDLERLDRIDWDIMRARYWNDNEDDNDRCRRRMAEFLVSQFFPWELVERIGVINSTVAERVEAALAAAAHKPEIRVERGWYY
jgi:hypothetical protein